MGVLLRINLFAAFLSVTSVALIQTASAASSISLTASVTNILPGRPVSLTYNSSEMNVCFLYSVVPKVTLKNSQVGGLNGSITVNPQVTTKYRFDCYKNPINGWTTREVTVQVSTATPSVGLSASKLNILSGEPIELRYSSTNMNQCFLVAVSPYQVLKNSVAGGINGVRLLSPTSTTTYRIDCYRDRSDGWTSKYVTITVRQLPPKVLINASASSVYPGTPVRISYSSTSMNVCNLYAANPFRIIKQSQAGGLAGVVTVTPQATTTYQIDCYQKPTDGWTTERVTVSVGTNRPKIILAASSAIAHPGASVELLTHSVGMNVCQLYSVQPEVMIASSVIGGLNGSARVAVNQSTDYRLACYHSRTDGWTVSQIRVQVGFTPAVIREVEPLSCSMYFNDPGPVNTDVGLVLLGSDASRVRLFTPNQNGTSYNQNDFNVNNQDGEFSTTMPSIRVPSTPKVYRMNVTGRQTEQSVSCQASIGPMRNSWNGCSITGANQIVSCAMPRLGSIPSGVYSEPPFAGGPTTATWTSSSMTMLLKSAAGFNPSHFNRQDLNRDKCASLCSSYGGSSFWRHCTYQERHGHKWCYLHSSSTCRIPEIHSLNVSSNSFSGSCF